MDIWARLKNKGFWVAFAAFILLLCQTFGVHIVPDQFNEVVNTALGLLVMLGILNDPTTGQWFGDNGKDNTKP